MRQRKKSYRKKELVRRPHKVIIKKEEALTPEDISSASVVTMLPVDNQRRLERAAVEVNKSRANVAHLKSIQGYRFKDRDPVIDQVVSLLDQSGMSDYRVSMDSFVAPSTIKNWRFGKTRRPQHTTLRLVLKALGYEFTIQPAKKA